jgi:hypothetical protein
MIKIPLKRKEESKANVKAFRRNSLNIKVERIPARSAVIGIKIST